MLPLRSISPFLVLSTVTCLWIPGVHLLQICLYVFWKRKYQVNIRVVILRTVDLAVINMQAAGRRRLTHRVANDVYIYKAQVRHTLQPLCDLSVTKIQNDRRGRRGVATRFCSWSATNRGLVADWSATGRRLVGDLVGTSLRLDATGRRPVGDWSPTSRRSVADQVNLKLM